MPMPETAVGKDDGAKARQDNVRLSGHVANMDAEAEPQLV